MSLPYPIAIASMPALMQLQVFQCCEAPRTEMPRLWAGASAWPKVDAAHPKHQDTHVLIIDHTCFHDISRYLRSTHYPPIMLKKHCRSITTPGWVPKAMEKSRVID